MTRRRQRLWWNQPYWSEGVDTPTAWDERRAAYIADFRRRWEKGEAERQHRLMMAGLTFVGMARQLWLELDWIAEALEARRKND